MNKLGWIGVGKMGQRMSRHLLCDENKLYVFDTFQANADVLVKEGAEAAASPAELATKADIMFSMIPNGKILLDIIAGENGLLKTIQPGQVLVDMSTVDPKSSAEAAKLLEEKGAIMMRAPVSGSTMFAESGTLKIMVSGDKATFDRVRPFLAKIGDRQTYLGDGEQARYIKLAINMMIGNMSQMVAESLVFCQAGGLDWETAIDLIADSAAASPMVKAKADALKRRDFSPTSTNRFMEKDMHMVVDIAHEKGLALPCTSLCDQMYNGMIGGGRGELDYYSLLLINEEMNGIHHKDA